MGGISEAQVPVNPLPANLQNGLNLPWVFGNAEYLYSRYDTAYNPTRLSNLLTTSDFLEIKQAGFDHVRIPIDIECFDLNADGSLPTQAPIGSPMASLLETIDEAINCDPSGEGLAVILAFHPGLVQTVRSEPAPEARTSSHRAISQPAVAASCAALAA